MTTSLIIGADSLACEHAPGHEPQVELLIGRLSRRLLRRRHDDRPLVGIAVELPARSLLDVGVVAFAVAPARLLAVDHRPTQPAHLMIDIERGIIVPVAAPEAGRGAYNLVLVVEQGNWRVDRADRVEIVER